ncbi:Protease 4 [Galdieria sulphuraria]|nr:Protease 4 [Galdieria sulphuraria]
MSFRRISLGTWKFAKFVGRGVRASLAVVGLATAGSIYVAHSLYRNLQNRVPQELGTGVLDLDLSSIVVVEKEPSTGEALFQALQSGGKTKPKISLRRLVASIDKAASDPRITALIAHGDDFSSSFLGLAVVKDIRDAIVRFRKKTNDAKPTIFYTDTFGELMGNATSLYYLASACEDVRMQPSGSLGWVGLSTDVVFIRKLLDQLGIVPKVLARYEYKNAPNTFTETELTVHQREQLQVLMSCLGNKIAEDVAESRNLSIEGILALMNEAPFTARESLHLRLIEGLSYRHDLMNLIKDKVEARRTIRATARTIAVDECLSAVEQLQRQHAKFSTTSPSTLEAASSFVESCLRLLDLFPWEMNPDNSSTFHYKEWIEQQRLLENLKSCLQQVSHMSEEEIKEKRQRDPWLDKYLRYAETVINNASTLPFIDLSNASKKAEIAGNESSSDKTSSQMTDNKLKRVRLLDYAFEMKMEESIASAKEQIERIRKKELSSKGTAQQESQMISSSSIAIVHLVGSIMRDDSSGGSKRLCSVLERAVRDNSIGAIVLRISSPGGSYVASDTIHHAVETATKVKPVIASFGDVVASGGYFSAAPCTCIVAQPTTITGSIGAFTLRFIFKEAAEKLGVSIQSPSFGKHASAFAASSLLEDWDEEMQDRANRFLDLCYEDFVEKSWKDMEWSGCFEYRIGG